MMDANDRSFTEESPPSSSGFIRFYGLFWDKHLVGWREGALLGQPKGWIGSKPKKDTDPKQLQMNFWGQKGVYVLYNESLVPVYAGQAGLVRKKRKGAGRTIGDRLSEHWCGPFRNGWRFFSWFGAL